MMAYADAIIVEHACSSAEAREHGGAVVYVAWGHEPGSTAWQWEGVHVDLADAEARVGPARLVRAA